MLKDATELVHQLKPFYTEHAQSASSSKQLVIVL